MGSAHRRSAGARTWTAAVVALTVLAAQLARADAPATDAAVSAGAPVDAGATAPTPPDAAAAPVLPVAPPGSGVTPTLTPDLPVVAAPALDQPSPAGPPPQGKPFYRKDWFWGAVGVVVLTAAIVLVATSGSSSDAPMTTLGNMRAF
ncbi:MAG TPA: hypothetical protein VHM31_09680 [Polyangia bacterium]|nr:hypothetical protein [Polyangia bacterium]